MVRTAGIIHRSALSKYLNPLQCVICVLVLQIIKDLESKDLSPPESVGSGGLVCIHDVL